MENKRKLHFEEGVGPVTCPTHDCNHLLHEKHEVYWYGIETTIKCRKCESNLFLTRAFIGSLEVGWLTFRFFCKTCREQFDRKIPVERDRCGGCKAMISSYSMLHLFVSSILDWTRLPLSQDAREKVHEEDEPLPSMEH